MIRLKIILIVILLPIFSGCDKKSTKIQGNIESQDNMSLNQEVLNNIFLNSIIDEDLELIEKYINEGADVNAKQRKDKSALIRAIHTRNFEIVDILLKNGADINLKDKYNIPPLIWAVHSRLKNIVALLLFNNCDKNLYIPEDYYSEFDGYEYLVFKKNTTALSLAEEHNYADIIRLLSADQVIINIAKEEINTPIIYVVKKGEQNVIEYIIPNHLVYPDREQVKLNNELFEAAKNGDIEKIKNALKAGANINGRDNHNSTSLMQTARYSENIDAIQYLIKQGANLDLIDDYASTALSYALGMKKIEMTKHLISIGANPNTLSPIKGYTILIEAIYFNNIEIAEYLIDFGVDINIPGRDGTTALMRACSGNKIDLIIKLISAGTNVNAKNNNGWTALFYSADGKTNVIETVELLLNEGANLNEKSIDIHGKYSAGTTVLSIAKDLENNELINYLLEAGAIE